MGKKILIPILLVATIVLVFGCTTTNNEDSGRVVFAITEAAANMGSVSEVNITVDSIHVQNSNGAWLAVSTESRTYELLKLKAENKTVLFADTNLPSGEYNKVRLSVSNVIIVDDGGSHQAKMPSGKIDIHSMLRVDTNGISTVTFDFIADESLHVTGQGKYIMAPVIHVETRSNTNVIVSGEEESDSRVIITGGQITTDKRVGMDLRGNIGVGVRIPTNIDITIETDFFGNEVIGSNTIGSATGNVTGNIN